MNLDVVEKIANAVLYEGYMLYPYTASAVKNQRRWNFGVLAPPGQGESEMQTECLARCAGDAALEVKVRFLQYTGGQDETAERSVSTGCTAPCSEIPFRFTGTADIRGKVEITVSPLETGLFRITVRIRNLSAVTAGDPLHASMLSTHSILMLHGGEFYSMIDPPEHCREAAKACRNVGTWPVLAGIEGERDTMLSSPIILYDYPQIAPESPGDLFDATEIDEILTLRILTLSDEEKAEIRAGGERARKILERSESLPAEQLMKLHGAIRGLRRVNK